MASYSLEYLAEIVGGKLIGTNFHKVKYLITDSRQVASPSESLFIAIRGKQHDGHQFVDECYQIGMRLFVVERDFPLAEYPNAQFLVVKNSLAALQEIARAHREQFNIPVIGITGSNGKTIVKEWLAHFVSKRKKLVRSPKSFNSQLGVPLSIWLTESYHDMAIFEAGISQPGEMEKLETLIQPNLGLITNIGEAHQENFGNPVSKLREKLKLFKDTDTILYCADHTLIDETITKDPDLSKQRLFTWSMQNREADLFIESVNHRNGNTRIEAKYRDKTFSFEIPFIDQASVENVIHVVLALLFLGFETEFIKQNSSALEPVAMRLHLKQGIYGTSLINDSYNSDIGSLRIALNFLSQQHHRRNKTLIFSDIAQSGRNPEDLYREVAELIRDNEVGRFIGIGPVISQFREYFKTNSLFYNSTDEFLAHFHPVDFRDEAILLKGAREFEFERISALIEEKVHNTILEINLNALIHNLNKYRSLIDPATQIMVMVKAFSYGSGGYEIASVLEYHRVDYLAVAYVDEGIALREGGIRTPIMVMSPESVQLDTLLRYNLEPEVYGFTMLKELEKQLSMSGITSYPIHIKLDTGMHRLGFMDHELTTLIDELLDYRHIFVKSVFTHLAASEDPAQDNFTRDQIRIFREMANRLSLSLGTPIIRHVLNSAGVERFPQEQMDMVRLGIGLYGVSSGGIKGLMPVGTLKSIVIQVKKIKAGQSIGYGRLARPERDTAIAIIPIGYADGLDRRLGDGAGTFMIRGEKVPTIGNICMDMCMLDVTGKEVEVGDEVLIFGKDLPVADMAGKLKTIPYEILTGISGRVKRVYYQE